MTSVIARVVEPCLGAGGIGAAFLSEKGATKRPRHRHDKLGHVPSAASWNISGWDEVLIAHRTQFHTRNRTDMAQNRTRDVPDTAPRQPISSRAGAAEASSQNLHPDSGRSHSRKQVLARAKRMLAAALEEEASHNAQTRPDTPTRLRYPAVGNGAWWLF